MKSGGGLGSPGNDDVVICLSDDDEDEDDLGDGGNSCEEVAASPPSGAASASSAGAGDLPIASPPTASTATPSRPNSQKGGGSADPAIAASPTAPSTSAGGVVSPGTTLRPSTPSQGANKNPGLTSSASTTPRRIASPAANSPSFNNSTRAGGGPSAGVTTPGSASAPAPTMRTMNFSIGEKSGNRDGTPGNEREDRAATQRSQARKRNSFVQTVLSTPGCVLVIENLELDVQPQDVLGQLTKFNNNKEKIHSVHVPPPYPELNYAVGYVVFLKKEFADAAAAFLTRNFVVSARGRPWVISRCDQKLNEEDFGFPTLSAFKGEAQGGDGDSHGGLKIITENQEAQYSKAKKRLAVFVQHKKQSQVMFQRHAQEEKHLEENPNSDIYL